MSNSSAHPIGIYFNSAQHIERQLALGAMWTLVGIVSAQAIALGTSVVFARVLGQQGFGELNVIRITVLMLASFGGGGLAIAATKHVAEFRDRQPDKAGSVLGLLLGIAVILSLLGATIFLFMSKWISEAVLHAAYLNRPLQIGSIMLITSVLSSVQTGALQGNACFRAIASMNVIEAVLTAIIGILGGLVMGLDGAMLGLGAAAILSLLVRHYVLNHSLTERQIVVSYKKWRTDSKLLGSVAAPSMLLAAIVQPAEWLGRVLIARGPDGFNQVAIFSAAQSIATIAQLGPSQIANASVPVLTQMRSLGAFSMFRMTLMRTTAWVLLCGVLVGGLITVASKPLLALYGESFAVRNDVLMVLALTYGVAVITMVWGAALIAADKTWSQFFQKAFWAVGMIGVAYLLADQGALGLAYAYAFGNAILTLVQVIAIRNLLVGTETRPA